MSGRSGPDRYGNRPGERKLAEHERAAWDHPGGAGALVLPHVPFLAWGRRPVA